MRSVFISSVIYAIMTKHIRLSKIRFYSSEKERDFITQTQNNSMTDGLDHETKLEIDSKP